jgi:hypothetical protein
MKRFSSPCPARSWRAGEGEAAARLPRVALGPAGTPEALARAALCPGGQRQHAPRQHQCDQGFLEAYERRKLLLPYARVARPMRLVVTDLGISFASTRWDAVRTSARFRDCWAIAMGELP